MDDKERLTDSHYWQPSDVAGIYIMLYCHSRSTYLRTVQVETIFEWHPAIHFVKTSSIAFTFRQDTFKGKCINISQWNNCTTIDDVYHTIQQQTITLKAVHMQYLVAYTKKRNTEMTSCSMIDTQIQWHGPLSPFFIFAKSKRDSWLLKQELPPFQNTTPTLLAPGEREGETETELLSRKTGRKKITNAVTPAEARLSACQYCWTATDIFTQRCRTFPIAMEIEGETHWSVFPTG